MPKVVGKHLLCLHYTADTRLATGAYGILEPDHRDALISEDIDAVLVPGLAFTRRGLRLGRGAGFFDRFLASTEAKRIGVCFSCQIAPWLPIDEWDMRMDAVVCPDEIIYTCLLYTSGLCYGADHPPGRTYRSGAGIGHGGRCPAGF